MEGKRPRGRPKKYVTIEDFEKFKSNDFAHLHLAVEKISEIVHEVHDEELPTLFDKVEDNANRWFLVKGSLVIITPVLLTILGILIKAAF